MTSAGLVIVETTNHIYNPDVFKVCSCLQQGQGVAIEELARERAARRACPVYAEASAAPSSAHARRRRRAQAITHKCVLSWQRVRAANLLAASGDAWVAVFKRFNSGTYNNQYMVTDLNK